MEVRAMQRKVMEFAEKSGVETNIEFRLLDLVSEIGELSKEMLKSTNYGTTKYLKSEEWTYELGDVLFSLICVANTTEVDLEVALDMVLNKYYGRLNERGTIGSL